MLIGFPKHLASNWSAQSDFDRGRLCATLDRRNSVWQVPDHLCCKLTMEIFRDPVITPSGVTYERTAILEHLRRVGKFDPVTRATLGEKDLSPNLALKEAVQCYLEEHGWAYRLT